MKAEMSLALNRESFFWHKVHSLTGVIPVGYYMAQHLVLNSFTLGGPEKFNGVIEFFEGIPKHFLIVLEVFAIWLPLIFHAIYGMFIVGRSQQNFIGTKYGWSQNSMYTFQRYSGIFLFFALIFHVSTTTVQKYITGNAEAIKYAAWHDKLTANGGILLIFYVLLVLTASYHLGYGIWNFCIRWGITVTDAAQARIQKLAFAVFIFLTLTGWGALAGFLIHPSTAAAPPTVQASLVR
jgi:succinate dehydrogenase / fumarate reductase cytochrome b subunit